MLTSYSCIGNRVRSVIRDPATAAPGINNWHVKNFLKKIFFYLKKKKLEKSGKFSFIYSLKFPT